MNNTSNIDDIHSYVPPQEKISYQATYTTTCLMPMNDTVPIAPVELHKKIPPADK